MLQACSQPKFPILAFFGGGDQREVSYLGRYYDWHTELNFRHLKQTLRMDVLRCQTVEGVKKELTVYALVYNLIRLVMLTAAQQQGVPVERISFIDAVRWLIQAIHGNPRLHLRVNPHRPERVEPRAVKRRPKQYRRLNKPRLVLRKQLLGKGNVA